MGCISSSAPRPVRRLPRVRVEQPQPMVPSSSTTEQIQTIASQSSMASMGSMGSFADWRSFLSFNTYFNQTDEPQILEYKFIRSIGRGGHAEVYLVEHVETKELYAAKIYSKLSACKSTLGAEQMIDKITREIEIMFVLKHPNIISLKEVLDDDETNSIIFILFYASHGSLLPRGAYSKPMPEERCRWIFAQVAHGLREVHQQNIVHRDIKPENILMHDNDRALLSDFSASRVLDEDGLLEDSDGTPVFYSPEECRGTAYLAKPTDVWALGVSLYVMIYGHLPFFDLSNDAYYLTQLAKISTMIQESPVEFDPDVEVSDDLRDLFEKILDKNPDTRLTIEEVLEHPWVQKAGYDPDNIVLPEYLRE